MRKILLLAILAVFLCGTSVMAVMTNPDPSIFANDDGTELFVPSTQVISIEIVDILGGFPGKSTFGFFFNGTNTTDPSNLITIFDQNDQDPNPGGPNSIPQIALIDFSSGIVYDVDNPNFAIDPSLAVQGTFSGSGNIGFFLTLDPSLADISLFSVASLNNGGMDAVGTFRMLGNPQNYLLGFVEPTTQTFLGYNIIGNVAPVPEPASILLLGAGIAGLVAWRRWNK
jgi:hypothetical protein